MAKMTISLVFHAILAQIVVAQQPDPFWDDKTKGLFYMRLNETWNTFTNNWPKKAAEAARQYGGPPLKTYDVSMYYKLPKESALDLIGVQFWSADFSARATSALATCEAYLDYDYSTDAAGNMKMIRVGFVKDPKGDKISLWKSVIKAQCYLGSVECREFLACIFGQISKQGDLKKCATSHFSTSAAENFQKCAVSRNAAYFMDDGQSSWNEIQNKLKTYAKFVTRYDALPKCTIGYGDRPKPFDGACPTTANDAWVECGKEKPTPSPSGALTASIFNNFGFGLSFGLILLAKSLIFA